MPVPTLLPSDAADVQRLVDEPPKLTVAGRTPYQRDRARVLHSSALRRLAGKTQVVGPGESDDFPRTRLTHSLECAQIGRELAASLGADPDLVDAACLAHDLGHPPFGHNGERALDAAAEPCGGFEGNAQSLRLLTRLEVKVAGAGLNLTRATLDATVKYPWARPAGGGKFGAYPDDMAALAFARQGAPEGVKSFEAQIMDFADDCAYSVHDLEDGLHTGAVDLLSLDPEELCAVTAELYSPLSPAALLEVWRGLQGWEPFAAVLEVHPGTLAGELAAKRLASETTAAFTQAAVTATRARYGAESLHRYAASLVVPPWVAAQCALLKGVAMLHVMREHDRLELQVAERALVTELVADLCAAAPGALPPSAQPAWAAAIDDAARLRVVVDVVASFTDGAARAWHARLTG